MEIIIIGAGPVGAYTAGILGYAGFHVKCFEKSTRTKIKSNIGITHFDVFDYEPLGLPRPPQGHPLYLDTFETLWQVPFNEAKKFGVEYPTDIIYLSPFIEWIIDWAEESQNVEFIFEAPFERPIIADNFLIGVEIGHNIGKIFGDLIIDCSGMNALVRNSIAPQLELTPLKMRQHRTFTVYMEEWDCQSPFPQGSNTYVSFKGFANQIKPQSTLVGASTLNGWDASKDHCQKMQIKQGLDTIAHNTAHVYGGDVPYDFPPSTLVANGFLSIGDAAFQNKPFNGEGMASGMKAAQVALEVIQQAANLDLERKFTRDNLWQYNVKYFHGIGADFAMIRGTGETLVELTPEEFDWMFENGFMDKKMLTTTWKYYKAQIGGKMLLSIFNGFKKWSLFKKIIKGILFGMKMKHLYSKYPKNPKDLAKWETKFQKLMQKLE